MITLAQKEIVKSTVPFLKAQGLALTQHFYKRMFLHNPELKNLFNMGNQQNSKQQTALAMAVLAYAEHIDHPEVLLPVLDGIGQKHVSLGIRPEHYLIVGEHLLAAIAEVVGTGATPELLKAWEAAYFQLADLMSGHEATIYKKRVTQNGGWTGWRPFIIRDKIQESAEISSFYLYPADQGPVADYQPGQFISVKVFLKQLELFQPRQYSISSAPNGKYYRISVKKETAHTPDLNGMVSNFFHDELNIGDCIDVSAPSGSFYLQESQNPVVFISGGVGQTPLIAMLETLVHQKSTRPKLWIHGCRTAQVHAFRDQLERWKTEDESLKQHTFYNQTTSDIHPAGYFNGQVDLNHFKDVFDEQAEYYLCGPKPFIEKQYAHLRTLGINSDRIFFEEFGPQTLQLN